MVAGGVVVQVPPSSILMVISSTMIASEFNVKEATTGISTAVSLAMSALAIVTVAAAASTAVKVTGEPPIVNDQAYEGEAPKVPL